MSILVFEKRALSYLIDYAIAFILSVVIVLFSNVFQFVDLPFTSNITHTLSLTFFIYFLMSTICLKLFNGKTIGRAITNLRVVSINGSTLSFSQILIRSLAESLLIIAFINVFYIIYYKNGYSLYDRCSDSCVK